jgi:uncharacterized membrane protein (UPF0127 family)
MSADDRRRHESADDGRVRSRRRWLRGACGLAVGGLAGVGGCLGRDGDGSTGDDSGADGSGDETNDSSEEAGGSGDDETGSGDDETGSGDDETDAIHAGYETRAVRVETADGDRLGSVTAAVADTPELRYTGLSDTESLPDDRGMLFVHESVGDRTYVMRRMAFGIDIVYADADGVITEIHHAPAPEPDEDGSSQGYPGRGKYVLEVGYRWTAERGVSAGDVLRFEPVA